MVNKHDVYMIVYRNGAFHDAKAIHKPTGIKAFGKGNSGHEAKEDALALLDSAVQHRDGITSTPECCPELAGMREDLLHFFELNDYLDDQVIPPPDS